MGVVMHNESGPPLFPLTIPHVEGKPYGLVYFKDGNEVHEYFPDDVSRTRLMGSLTNAGYVYLLYKMEKYQPM
jgi:predicted alpha/beta superfamily hydrolase